MEDTETLKRLQGGEKGKAIIHLNQEIVRLEGLGYSNSVECWALKNKLRILKESK